MNTREISMINNAKTLIDSFDSRLDMTVRLLGSTAVALKSPKYIYLWDREDRLIGDIDFTYIPNSQIKEREIVKHMEESGYLRNYYFDQYKLKTQGRLLFDSKDQNFLIEFHPLPIQLNILLEIQSLFSIEEYTISLSDLVVSKLQRYEITRKEFIDLSILFLEHQFGTNDCCSISLKRISSLCMQNWVLHSLVLSNLKRFEVYVREKFCDEAVLQERILEGISLLTNRLSKLKYSKLDSFKSKYFGFKYFIKYVHNPSEDHVLRFNFNRNG